MSQPSPQRPAIQIDKPQPQRKTAAKPRAGHGGTETAKHELSPAK